MTSIIILTFNKLEYTKKCIESIRKYTDKGSYEIIVVDNASTDGTIEWLKGQGDIIKIFNNVNVGFPKGCNQGIAIAKGSEILLLNNDVIVTPVWLNNMLKALYSNKKVGAVGPVTNSGPGQEISVNYTRENEINDFAVGIAEKLMDKYKEKIKLIGFCMLIKKNVLDKVGVLDDIFSPGNYEDDDISLRIILGGYKLLLCEGVFIHHFGSESFGENKKKFHNLLLENKIKFKEKWSLDLEYLSICRYDLIDIINLEKDNLKILDVGCGLGNTLLEIKNINSTVDLYGIEKNVQAAKVAESFAEILIGDVETIVLPYPDEFFDYIILGDILECLYSPEKFLNDIKKYLCNNGEIIVSCRNVQYIGVLQDLLAGDWGKNKEYSINKETIRFFTLKELEKIFIGLNYKIKKYEARITDIDEQNIDFLKKLKFNKLIEDDFNFRIYQWIFQLKKSISIIGENYINKMLKLIEAGKLKDEEFLKLINVLFSLKLSYEDLFYLMNDLTSGNINVLLEIAIEIYNLQYKVDSIKFLLEIYKKYPEDINVIYTLSFLLKESGDIDSAIKVMKNSNINDYNMTVVLGN